MKNSITAIKPEDLPEFIGQIIDTFEDFLDEKGVFIKNLERDADEEITGENNCAIIYGEDYGRIADDIRNILVGWKLIKT